MNKFIVLLVTATMLVWGVFLYRMADNVNGNKGTGSEVAEVRTLDFKSLLKNLNAQTKMDRGARDPFALPQSYAPKVQASVKNVKKENHAVIEDAVRKAPPPSITLDAILPGSNPVAILKFRGESAVVSVGQEIWGVTVKTIDAASVTLVYSDGEFTLMGN